MAAINCYRGRNSDGNELSQLESLLLLYVAHNLELKKSNFYYSELSCVRRHPINLFEMDVDITRDHLLLS